MPYADCLRYNAKSRIKCLKAYGQRAVLNVVAASQITILGAGSWKWHIVGRLKRLCAWVYKQNSLVHLRK
jgi:hypothetical protein